MNVRVGRRRPSRWLWAAWGLDVVMLMAMIWRYAVQVEVHNQEDPCWGAINSGSDCGFAIWSHDPALSRELEALFVGMTLLFVLLLISLLL